MAPSVRSSVPSFAGAFVIFILNKYYKCPSVGLSHLPVSPQWSSQPVGQRKVNTTAHWQESFIALYICRHEEMRKSCEPHAKGILIGNRCHLSHLREVQPEEGKNLAEHLRMPFYETSTEKNININECFDELVDSILEEIERGRQLKELNTLLLPASGQEDRAVEACSCKLLWLNNYEDCTYFCFWLNTRVFS